MQLLGNWYLEVIIFHPKLKSNLLKALNGMNKCCQKDLSEQACGRDSRTNSERAHIFEEQELS